jgi:hypothetical protein
MKVNPKKRLVLIGIRRKGEQGFKIKTNGESTRDHKKRN